VEVLRTEVARLLVEEMSLPVGRTEDVRKLLAGPIKAGALPG